MSAVPSGDPSSMTRMWKHFSRAKMALMIFSMFSFSLYVGMITMLSLLFIVMLFFIVFAKLDKKVDTTKLNEGLFLIYVEKMAEGDGGRVCLIIYSGY